jgi:hypothetical protein
MSKIRTMGISVLFTMEGEFCSDPQPGDMVSFYMAPGSLGTIVKKISENQVEVLWSNFKNPFDNIVRPLTRNYTQISQQVFQVQPMPQGAIPFYLDHRFGEKKD